MTRKHSTLKKTTMMTRNRKKTGRGYTREAWIQHHRRIVESSELRERTQGNNSVAERGENPEKVTNKSEQYQGLPKEVVQQVSFTSTTEGNEYDGEIPGKFVKVCPPDTGKNNQNDTDKTITGDRPYGCTEKVRKPDTTTQGFTNVNSYSHLSERKQTNVHSNKALYGLKESNTFVSDKEQAGVKCVVQNATNGKKQGMIVDAVWHTSTEIQNVTINDEHQDGKKSPHGVNDRTNNRLDNRGRSKTEKSDTDSVANEDMSEATNDSSRTEVGQDETNDFHYTQTNEREKDISVKSQSASEYPNESNEATNVGSDSDELFSETSSSVSDTDEEMSVSTDDSGRTNDEDANIDSSFSSMDDGNSLIGKRKTAIEQSTKHQKRTHSATVSQPASATKSGTDTVTDMLDEERQVQDREKQSLSNINLQRPNPTEGTNNNTTSYPVTGEDARPTKVQKHSSEKIRHSSTTVAKYTGTTVPVHQSDSDIEWEIIANKLKKAEGRNSGTGSKNRDNNERVTGKKNTHRVSFSRYNTVLKGYNNTSTDQLKERGLRMTDNMEKLTTPIKIEYNIDSTTDEFQIIDASLEFFSKLHEADPTVRIFSSENKTLLWDSSGEILAESDFQDQFQVRVQTFRKGNMKATIYCTVESKHTINRMKFTDPLKSYIQEKNIWVKPDYYSTKVVSSPGFLTLLHPKMTNKKETVKSICASLTQIKIDPNDPVVTEWNNHANHVTDTLPVIPPFHLETSTRKWGNIHTEVISVHCSQEDSKYLKHLLVESGTQGVLSKGLFIPSGIHLIEGKEILTHILTEQEKFITDTTSFQLDGIAADDMHRPSPTGETIYELLRSGPGVKAVEATFHTEYRGQWLLVVEKTTITQLTEYITTNITKIYKNKTDKKPKLVTYTMANSAKNYRLSFLSTQMGRVGTYADILKKRFPMEKHERHTVGGTINTGQTTRGSGISNENKNATALPNNPVIVPPANTDTTFEKPQNPEQGNHTETDEGQVKPPKWEQRLHAVEADLLAKLMEIDNYNKQVLTSVEKRVEDKIEQIVEKKLKHTSDKVAKKVTKQVVKALSKMLKMNQESDGMAESMNPKTDIGQDTTKTINKNDTLTEKHREKEHKPETNQKTADMIYEITQIEQQTGPPSDSPHDTLLESRSSSIMSSIGNIQTEIDRTQTQEPHTIEQGTNANDPMQEYLQLFDFTVPLPKKTNNTIRIFYNNCNGVEINNTIGVYLKQQRDKQKHSYIQDIESPTKLDSIIRQMKRWEVDVVTLAETCVAWENKVPRRVIQQITHPYDRQGCWTGSSSAINTGGFIKPGGTGMLAMGQSNGLILDRGADPWKMGRWTYNLLKGPTKDNTLLIVTGYQTGVRTGTPGLKTAWSQQQTMLLKENRPEKPHEAFYVDLTKWIRQYRTNNMEILICLDANEQWGANAKIKSFAEDLDLLNINHECTLADTHPNLANTTRNTTIDFCLGSHRVVENLVYAASVPYDMETLGDHRGIILDINTSILLGEIPPTEDIRTRKLVLSNPKAVTKYLDFVERRFQKQNIMERSQKLMKRVVQGHTALDQIMQQYDLLDREVFGICQKAEKKCKPAWAGKFEWSPKLAKTINHLRYWRLRVNKDRETTQIKRLGEVLSIPYTQMSKCVKQQMVNIYRAQLTEVQKNDRQHRKDHLTEVAEKYAEQNQLSTQQAIIELLTHEDARSTFRILRQRLKPSNRSGLRTLWVSVDENGNYQRELTNRKVYTKKEEIHDCLLRRNKDHLSQASGTPFAKGRLKHDLKWDGTGRLADDILQGNILNKQRYNASLQLYLECLQVQDFSNLNIVQPHLTLEEYKLFWKKKRETTVTSPFGLHVGHYKASLQKLTILDVHRILLLIPFKTGIAPARWKKTVQTMLEKEPGTPWIHRLRIIELFDAQANAGFQIFVGRNLMQHAVRHNILQEESFGSTPGKMATSAVLQKILTVDQLRLERRAGGIFDCDASGCFDRILPPLASVHMRAMGLHQSIGTLVARLMFQARRYVKTHHGVSKRNIRTTKKNVLHGIGQGNGGGPAMWIAHLTIMFAAISSVCSGFVLTCIQKLKTAMSVGTGYVDDVTLGLSIPRDQSQTEHKVYRHIKRMAQTWEKLLYITGGRLELSKCFWVPITWTWRNGIPYLANKRGSLKQLYLWESESKEAVKIQRKHGTDTEKRLGIYSSCDGKWSTEVKQWVTYSRQFSKKVKHAGLNRAAGYLAYHSLWLAKFRYSAAVIGYTYSNLHAIQSSAIGACLSAAGYSNKFPRAVVFGPPEYGGLDWANIAVVVLYEKIKMFIGSVRLQDNVGRMIEIQLSWLQLIAGITIPILQMDVFLKYLPLCWMTNLHYHLVEHGLQIEVSAAWHPKPQRKNDRVLMDIVLKQVPAWAWAGINRCRLYLNVTTVADLTTLDGKYIPQSIRSVKTKLRDNKLLFPLQSRPSKQDRVQWKFALDLFSQDGHLYVPLGAWTRQPDQIYPYVINEDDTAIYKKVSNGWRVYCKTTPSSRRYKRMQFVVDTAPTTSYPSTRVLESSNFIIHNRDDNRPAEPYTDVDTCQQQMVEAAVLGEYIINENKLDELKEQWHEPNTRVICATDGGLKDMIGSSSYAIFFPEDSTPIISGGNTEYQPRLLASSTRQELLGQLSIAYWMERLSRTWGIPRRKLRMKLITDSQASVDIMTGMDEKHGLQSMLRGEMDVALDLHKLRTEHFWLEWCVEKVHSHITEDEAPDQFSWYCNDYVDQLATRKRLSVDLERLKVRRTFLLPGTKACCRIAGRLENNSLSQILKAEINGKRMREYLMEKYDWTAATYAQIDWVAHQREIGKTSRYQKVTLLKYIHGWLATTSRKFRENRAVDDKCPLCGGRDNRHHIFLCSNERMKTIRDQYWRILLKDISGNTTPEFQAIFQAGLHTAMGGENPSASTQAQWPREFLIGYQTQEEIGWTQVFYGRIAKHWDVLANYCPRAGTERRPGIWTGRAIKNSWRFGLELWKARNKLVHGADGGTSQQEQGRVSRLTIMMIRELLPQVPPTVREWVNLAEEDADQLTHQNKLAWLDRLKFLFPQWYRAIESQTNGSRISSHETELHFLTQTGTDTQ